MASDASPVWRRPAAGCAGGFTLLALVVFCFQWKTTDAQGNAPSGQSNQDRDYAYKSYTETMRFFEDLKRAHPELVDTFIAQEAFPGILPSASTWATCEGQPCKSLVVRIGNKRTLTETSPEVFFSGALHGDEQVGPLTVTELAAFLCEQHKAGNEEIRRLVDTRGTWIMPMTNPHGYSMRKREENGMDPNRDFPYLQRADNCMRTQTARAVNELFRRHLFQFTLTFHGGMRALTYEWGSKNHMVARKSTESPDDRAFTAVGKSIQASAGREKHRSRASDFYPLGRINDLVYPVDGGMEDWSYGAGWEESPSPITVCKPTTYGGYDQSRTKYKPGSVATLVYLAEMDDMKTPRANTLGRTSQMWDMPDDAGHVPRNMKMCLKLIEFAKPEVIVHPPAWPNTVAPQSTLELVVHGFGCLTLNTARLLLVPRQLFADCGTLNSPQGAWAGTGRDDMLAQALEVAALAQPTTCRGLTIWDHSADRGIVSLRGAVPTAPSGEYCAVVVAEFDQDWGQQNKPDPATRPRALATRQRLEDHYTAEASDGPMRVDEYRVKLFSATAQPVRVEGAPGAPVAQAAWPAHAPQPAPPTSVSARASPVPAAAPAAQAASSPEASFATERSKAPLRPLSLDGLPATAGMLRGEGPPAAVGEAAWTLLLVGMAAAGICACNILQGLWLMIKKGRT